MAATATFASAASIGNYEILTFDLGACNTSSVLVQTFSGTEAASGTPRALYQRLIPQETKGAPLMWDAKLLPAVHSSQSRSLVEHPKYDISKVIHLPHSFEMKQ
ncbi:hypothetical protein CVT25_009000 [Psilocybe cyanescens]|uniref:Uncharacterized protein n=1 Tax=Psilocybe cyanescens TaxID=93625 RepID=A0A409XNG2_PSICY|nr:hypothetical protein CVT25_009000 [Psilocybe cyanescens]